jgi:type II secretory pathway pseudopilin PulG
LIELGLVLLIMSLIIQVIAQVWLRWMARKAGV